MTHDSQPGRGGPPPSDLSLPWILAVLLRQRRIVVGLTVVGLAGGAVYAIVRPQTYTTSFSFVPQTESDASRLRLTSLATQFGLSLGATEGPGQSPQFYADLLRTRAVLAPIATDSFPVGTGPEASRVALPAFLHIKGDSEPVVFEKTLRALQRDVISSSVATRTTGVVTVDVRTRSPSVSLGIAEALVGGLTRFNVEIRQSQAAAERQFAEGRLAVARSNLRAGENALQRFLQANRQFERSSELTFERDRLQREVTLQEQLVIELAQQVEESRIREVRNTPVITVIERPAMAARADPRHRLAIMLGGIALGLFLSVLFALVRDAAVREALPDGDPAWVALRTEWRRVRKKPTQ